MFDDLIRDLEAWSQEHNLIEWAIESCKISLRNAAREDHEWFPEDHPSSDILDGHKLSDIQLRFRSQALIFKSALLSYPYIDTRIDLCVVDPDGFYSDGLEPIGYYRHIVRLDGEVDDDYLVLDEKPQDQT